MIPFCQDRNVAQQQQMGNNKFIPTQGYNNITPNYDRYVSQFLLPSPPSGLPVPPPPPSQPQSQGNKILMPSNDIGQYFGGQNNQS